MRLFDFHTFHMVNAIDSHLLPIIGQEVVEVITVGGSDRETSYPYKCTGCGKGFYNRSDLAVYDGNGTGKCLECLAEESRQRLLDDIQKNKTR